MIMHLCTFVYKQEYTADVLLVHVPFELKLKDCESLTV